MRLSRKKEGEVVPEVRLHGIWTGLVLVPVSILLPRMSISDELSFILQIGVLIWGFCIEYKTAYIGPVFGFGITCFAIQ